MLVADGALAAEPVEPTELAACPNQCLSHFRFDLDGWTGEQGERAQRTNGLSTVDGYFDGAVRLTGDTNALLRYAGVESSGEPNLSLVQGTVSFSYRALWATNISKVGAGAWMRLIELGRWTPDASVGCLALTIDPSGTNVWFLAQDNQGHSRSNLLQSRPPRVFFGARRWSQFRLAYSQEHVRVWVDGVRVLDLPSKEWPLPPASAIVEGFTIGSDSQGNRVAVGDYDEVEFLGYATDPIEVEFGRLRELRATVRTEPPRVTLHWRPPPRLGTKIERWDSSSSDWINRGTSPSYQFHDTEVQAGQRYEYRLSMGTSRVHPGRIAVGVGLPPVEDRGRVILLIDRAIDQELRRELNQFEEDLTGDGWEVIRQGVNRHDDTDASRNRAEVKRTRLHLHRIWESDPDRTRAVVIVGHGPIPFSGDLGPDGHGKRPWPADVVYGDVDGDWTDALAVSARNQPNDGVFDLAGSPSSVEMAVGRIDFAQLPALRMAPTETVAEVEIRCLRQYFQKNHRYRFGQLDLPLRVVVGTYFGNYHDTAIQGSVMKSLTQWFAPEQDRLIAADLFSAKAPALWGFLGGYGRRDGVQGARSEWHLARDFADPAKEPPIAFYVLKGSYFGVYSAPDNLLRSVLGGPAYGLASLWTMGERWELGSMGIGDSLGEALRRTQNDPASAPYNVLHALLGDPTLRFPVQPAPRELAASWTQRGVLLRWVPPESTSRAFRYRVYRSTRGIGGPFELLTTPAIEQTEFLDAEAPRVGKWYSVKSEQWVVTPSGSFTNLSQAVFVNLR